MELLIGAILLALLIPTAYASVIGAPIALTDRVLIEKMVQKTALKPGQLFYELGTGTGRVISAFSKNPDITAVGFELSPIFYFWTLLNILTRRNATLRLENFFKADLGAADAIFFFLMPKTIKKLKQKLEKELKPGAVVISYIFPVAGWEPSEIIKEKSRGAVYFYAVDRNRVNK